MNAAAAQRRIEAWALRGQLPREFKTLSRAIVTRQTSVEFSNVEPKCLWCLDYHHGHAYAYVTDNSSGSIHTVGTCRTCYKHSLHILAHLLHNGTYYFQTPDKFSLGVDRLQAFKMNDRLEHILRTSELPDDIILYCAGNEFDKRCGTCDSLLSPVNDTDIFTQQFWLPVDNAPLEKIIGPYTVCYDCFHTFEGKYNILNGGYVDTDIFVDKCVQSLDEYYISFEEFQERTEKGLMGCYYSPQTLLQEDGNYLNRDRYEPTFCNFCGAHTLFDNYLDYKKANIEPRCFECQDKIEYHKCNLSKTDTILQIVIYQIENVTAAYHVPEYFYLIQGIGIESNKPITVMLDSVETNEHYTDPNHAMFVATTKAFDIKKQNGW